MYTSAPHSPELRAQEPLLQPMERASSPRFLHERARRTAPSRKLFLPCMGLSFVGLFLFLLIYSTLNPPPVGPGRRTAMELATNQIMGVSRADSLVWDRLAEMTDLFGPRLSGSAGLEKSIDWMVAMIEADNLTVTTEAVTVDRWVRNEESLTLLLPSRPPTPMPMLGLGGSVGTPAGGIEAEVVVVQDVEELLSLGNQTIVGRIVLFDAPWEHYRSSVHSRMFGAAEAERLGAVAVLVRSATPFSLATPHTGAMMSAGIPAAAVTTEDADYLRRVAERHVGAKKSTSPFSHLFLPPVVRLEMNATFQAGGAKSRNIIIELPGRSRADEFVVMGGHIDSWDVGTGAVDDGAGFFVAWHALRAIAQLPVRPIRTIRAIGWVAEERGQHGARAYAKRHAEEIPKHVFAMESDTGVFQPWGLSVVGSEDAEDLLAEAGQHYLGYLGAGNVTQGWGGEDIAPLCKQGVPCAAFLSLDPITGEPPTETEMDGYFYYHHSNADTVSVLKPKELALAAGSMGVWAYVTAEMPQPLPRQNAKHI